MHNNRRLVLIVLAVVSLGLATSPAGAAFGQTQAPQTVETVALFDPAALETPENIAIDHRNNKYVSLALTGEIRRLAADGTQLTVATLPLGAPPLTFCGAFFAGLTGITLDEHGNLFANLASCDPAGRGVWKIPPDGRPARIAALPLAALPNGIVHHHGYLYVADSALGLIWRVSDQGGAAEVWASGGELAVQGAGLPGPNGLKLFGMELYVSNPSRGTVIAIEVTPDGGAGSSRIHASGVFCDDFAFDVLGGLYCGTDPFNTVLRIGRDGSIETVLTAADGLDGPTAAAFGHQGESFELYVTNGAFPFFPGPTPRRPSLMRISVDLPGFPPP